MKVRILNHPSCILSTLNNTLNDCQSRLSEFNKNQQSPPLSNMTDSPNLTIASSLNRRKYNGKKFYHELLHKKNKMLSKLKRKGQRKSSALSITIEDKQRTMLQSTTIIPSSELVREDWSGLIQLQHCSQWSLDHIFDHTKSLFSPRVTQQFLPPDVHLNWEECTSHCKLSSNYLEMRNDTFFLESARANTCVESGIWYYEVLLLTDGVIQVGWGTSKCLFLPEEGCGVGDDPVSLIYYFV